MLLLTVGLGHRRVAADVIVVAAALRTRVAQVVDDESAAVGVSGTLPHDPTVRATRSARSGELDDYQEALARVLGIEVDQ